MPLIAREQGTDRQAVCYNELKGCGPAQASHSHKDNC